MSDKKNLKERLAPILPALSISFIAREYFQKSRYWLYHKINGNIVNGAPAKFKPEELEVLARALKDIAAKIEAVDLTSKQ